MLWFWKIDVNSLRTRHKLKLVVESGMLKIGLMTLAIFGIGIILTYSIISRSGFKKTALVSPVVIITPTTLRQIEATISGIPDATPSSDLESSPSATIYPTKLVATESKAIAPVMTPPPTPTPETSQMVNGYIDQFSLQYGVDPNIIRHLAICESGFRTNAVNLGYVGLFQFDTQTWKKTRLEIGEDTNPDLRFSGKDSVQTAAYAISKNRSRMWPSCFPK